MIRVKKNLKIIIIILIVLCCIASFIYFKNKNINSQPQKAKLVIHLEYEKIKKLYNW
ncbi:hypothetical protein DFR81_10117 [Garciella nitratireducens]|nr:hypothetical protein DFR81_10117 [Garciella nitratireducens]